MNRIKSIKINNFKFFNNQAPIIIDGKNLLLYGENGSGKSTIYWALHTLLEASVKNASETAEYFVSLDDNQKSYVNIYAHELPHEVTGTKHYDTYIEVKSMDSTKYHLSLLDTSISTDTVAKEVRQMSDFINYQSLFKFHDFKHTDDSDLYDIFVSTILPYVNLPTVNFPIPTPYSNISNAEKMWEKIQEGPGTTQNSDGKTIQVAKKSTQFKNYKNFADNFISYLHKLIEYIKTEAPLILEKLGYDFKFDLNLTDPTYKKGYTKFYCTPFKIELVITEYNGKTVNMKKVHSFLNEAKMTALAISIRLSILSYRNSSQSNKLKFIVFDDVMISLDMSNRVVLSDYILNTLARNYQIIILTHSKEFTQFFQHKITQLEKLEKSNWIYKEMYTGSTEQNHEYPVIIDTGMSDLEKAKKYFEEIKDYEIAALYIRKSLEKAIQQKLPRELIEKIGNTFTSLESRWNTLKCLYSDSGNPIDIKIVKLFKDSKLLVLNPAAHFQKLSRPIYKKELESAFDLIDEINNLDKISNELVIKKGTEIIFKHPSENCDFTFKLKTDLIIKHSEYSNEVIITISECRGINFQYNNIKWYDFDTEKTNLNHILKKRNLILIELIQELIDLPLGITTGIFIDNSTIEGTPLKEYIGDLDLKILCQKEKQEQSNKIDELIQ